MLIVGFITFCSSRHQGIRHVQQRHRRHEADGDSDVHRRRDSPSSTGTTGIRSCRRRWAWANSAGAAWCAAAGVIFFAYIGFDAVSTAAQEAKNPQRDMPIGMLGSLGICTVLYIAVSLVLTGVVNYTQAQRPRAHRRGRGARSARRSPG
jgi:amino acid transporter